MAGEAPFALVHGNRVALEHEAAVGRLDRVQVVTRMAEGEGARPEGLPGLRIGVDKVGVVVGRRV